MSSTKETVYLGDNSEEIFISNIDDNGIIVYDNTLNGANKEVAMNNALIIEESLDDAYFPFKEQTTSLPKNSVSSQIGPFSDNRPICECDVIKKLCASTDARYLLSLLPDMAEMNPKQKIAFKNRIFQLINRVLNGDSIDVEM